MRPRVLDNKATNKPINHQGRRSWVRNRGRAGGIPVPEGAPGARGRILPDSGEGGGQGAEQRNQGMLAV